MLPPPQLVRGSLGGCAGAPSKQTSLVQTLPSSTMSPSSLTETVPPTPSHCTTLQSPGTCDATGGAAGVAVTPQAWVGPQVGCRHSLSAPQFRSARHSTQAPSPSQKLPVPQVAPAATGGFDGTPALQTSWVQTFWS